jgi:hypothetical protein
VLDDVPTACHSTFNCSHFIALHKDLHNLDKIRACATQHITAALAITVLGYDPAEFLLPQGQFGTGIPSGLDLITHSTMADLEQHLNPHSPTRALLPLDIIKRINAVSHKACRSMLENHELFCVLLPLFNMLCSVNNTCWCQKSNGTHAVFEQIKGLVKGCPLIAFLASLVLHILLAADLNTQLKTCATAQKANHACPGDNDSGSLTHTKSFINAVTYHSFWPHSLS